MVYAPAIPLLREMILDVEDHSECVRCARGLLFARIVRALKGRLGAVRYNIRLCAAVIRLMFLRQAVDSATGLFWFNTVIYFLYRGASLFFYPISKKFNIGIQNELARRREIKEE